MIIESVCNVFRCCHFLFTIPDDAWRSCYIPWTHFTHMRRQLLSTSGVLFDDTLVEEGFRLDHIRHLYHTLLLTHLYCAPLSFSNMTTVYPVIQHVLFALDVSVLHWCMCVIHTNKTRHPCIRRIVHISMLSRI